jgi:hypothetical protein
MWQYTAGGLVKAGQLRLQTRSVVLRRTSGLTPVCGSSVQRTVVPARGVAPVVVHPVCGVVKRDRLCPRECV